MGCGNSRADLSSEEQLLTAHEAYLQYAHNHVVHSDMVFRKNAPHAELNSSQLLVAANQLELALSNSGPSDVIGFYSKLKTENYSLNWLVLTSFFLCNGTPEEKAAVLFELYDPQNSDVLDSIKVGTMATQMFELACQYLPVTAQSGQTSAADQTAVKIYIAKLNHVKDLFIKKFIRTILKLSSRISKQDFIAAYSGEWLTKTTTSHGFRSAVFNEFAGASELTRQEFDRTFKQESMSLRS